MTFQEKYTALFNTCEIRPSRVDDTDFIVAKINAHRAQYDAIAKATGVPWYVVAVLHSRESGLRFDRHLHNGDPLTARTYHVPAGRPRTGTPPFTFVESAIDALNFDGLKDIADTSIGNLLVIIENYNGTGYRRKGIPSPYLWSFTNQYSSGKYVTDGKFDPNAVDAQCGCAALLLRMHQRGDITLNGTTKTGGVKEAETDTAAPWKLYKDTVSLATYIGDCGTDTDGSATYPVRLLLYALKGVPETTVNLSYNPVSKRLAWGDVTIPVVATDRDGVKIVPVRSVAVWAGYDVHADAAGRTITLKKKII